MQAGKDVEGLSSWTNSAPIESRGPEIARALAAESVGIRGLRDMSEQRLVHIGPADRVVLDVVPGQRFVLDLRCGQRIEKRLVDVGATDRVVLDIVPGQPFVDDLVRADRVVGDQRSDLAVLDVLERIDSSMLSELPIVLAA